jgi:ABC-type transport system involved in multi-copper enzyme maturation permease subunit
MSIWPVIVREMKAQSRQPLTYLLRIAGGLAIAAAFLSTFWSLGQLKGYNSISIGQNPVMVFGTALFGKLNLCIFLAIWILVPLSTADAICRERREGTLPLLYLTKLRSSGIIIGKAIAHVLRALSLLLTTGPWLLLPLLFGGVEVRDVAMALALDSIALILAFAAGLVASAIPKDWLKAVMLAEFFSCLLLLTMLHWHQGVLQSTIAKGTATAVALNRWSVPVVPPQLMQMPFGYGGGFLRRTLHSVEVTSNSSIELSHPWFMGPSQKIETHWQILWANLTPIGHKLWFTGVAGMAAKAGMVLGAGLLLASWFVRRTWRDTPQSALVGRLRSIFYSPKFRVKALRRNLSQSLSRNPIGWLQHYSAPARMVKWGWCLFILTVEILASSSVTDLYDLQNGLGLVLLLGLAFSATASFRDELETGAFELLLVTPLREKQIISGRVRGLWSQFLPAMAIYGVASIYLSSGWLADELGGRAWESLIWTMGGFCVIPLVGLYFSIQRLNFFAAWICACLVALGPSAMVRATTPGPTMFLVVQAAVAMAAASLVNYRLRNRGFLARKD